MNAGGKNGMKMPMRPSTSLAFCALMTRRM